MCASPVVPDARRPEEYADGGDSPTRERGGSGRLEAFLFCGAAGDLE
ncbi:MAG TPA: hypothetical protein VNC59_03940 [Thermoanaerobaculia bacterium]|nr:hypothetical protein [Thermoanaerobaculia bacterium]